jgi:hypothetical protein
MQYINHPFYVELVPESPEELAVARRTFGAQDGRSVMVKAAAEYERAAIVKKFQDAMRVG